LQWFGACTLGWPGNRRNSSSDFMSVTLYHWEPNANSGKPMLTLAEKGVAYHSHYLDLLQFDQHKPA
jgi:hypothetical protein